jgi:quinol monooxygenase YgiN
MELFIFARFHARQGQEDAVAAALREVVPPTRAEPGCRAIAAFRATGDARLFWVHSRWRDEAAFEIHGGLPHTARFVARVAPLIDHRLDVVRTRAIA